MDDMLLSGEGLVKEYGTVVKTTALQDVSLAIRKNEFASIIGPSGCGKSTLLNLLGALDQPTRGRLYFHDRELSAMSETELAAFRNRNIGFIFQFHHLLPEFNALENVLLPTWINSGKSDRQREERAKELLELVGLKDRMKNPANNLSGGQQQRVSIARALINDPALVLADEPTGNLDSDATEQVYDLLRDINAKLGMSFLIVTHDRHIAEKSDRVIEMADGRIVSDYKTADSSADDLWRRLAPHNCKFVVVENGQAVCGFDEMKVATGVLPGGIA